MGVCWSYTAHPSEEDLDLEPDADEKSHLKTHMESNQNNNEIPIDIEPELQFLRDTEISERTKNKEHRTETMNATSNPTTSVSSIKTEQSGESKADPDDLIDTKIEPHLDTEIESHTTEQVPIALNPNDKIEADTIINIAVAAEHVPAVKPSIEKKSSYHFIIPKAEIKQTNKDTYSTFVDYSKLFTKPKDIHAIKEQLTSTQKEATRADLIEIEQKETGIIIDQQHVAYNAWCSIKTSPTFIDQSKPKRIAMDTNNITTDNIPITSLPALLDCGDNQQRLLLMGFIRKMIKQFDFAWILPMDVLDVCFQYLPNEISTIFVMTGNLSSNYMEYHLFTAQNHEYRNKRMCSDSIDKHMLYEYKSLDFKINDKNGKEIRTLDEDFDCAHCGICYAENISIPSSMHRNNTMNEFIGYSAIIKCGGEIIEEDMNFCTNYCNAIMFDTNALLCINKEKKSNTMDINCFELKLPRLKTKCRYTSIYSEYHGLIAMEMDRKRKQSNVYQLSFKNKVANCYDWKPLNDLKYNHLYGSICMINNDENLVVLGGNNSNKMEFYDWNTKQWNVLQSIHYNTNYSGVCYNFLHDNILICGGNGASCRKSACYNIAKDKWYKLPMLQYKHRCYPTVFNHVDNPSIAYCFGDNNQSFSHMEYVDLRDHQQMIWRDINNSDMYHHISPSQIRNIVV